MGFVFLDHFGLSFLIFIFCMIVVVLNCACMNNCRVGVMVLFCGGDEVFCFLFGEGRGGEGRTRTRTRTRRKRYSDLYDHVLVG